MAIYNADEVMNRLNEQEVEEYDVLDNLVEACDAMMDMLSEADKNLKNEKEKHAVSGPEDYSKWNTNDLKDAYKMRANQALRSKYNRDDKDSYSGNTEYRSSSRAKAADIGKELAKRGEKVGSLKFSEREDDTVSAARKAREKDDYMRKKPGSYTFSLEDEKYPNAKLDDHPGTNFPSKAEREETKNVIRNHLDKKKAIKETCLYILSVIDEM